MIFGAPFEAKTEKQVIADATPPSGSSTEAIWDQIYDSQTYVDNTTVNLKFFQTTSTDDTLSNQTSGGMLTDPETFQIYNICLDVLQTAPVSIAQAAGALTEVGALNNLALLLLGITARPTWTLRASNKDYGPYSLTLLGGTGGPIGLGWGSSIATSSGSVQYARTDSNSGWNYWGAVIIKPIQNYGITLKWFAAANISADVLLRVSMLGVKNRAIR